MGNETAGAIEKFLKAHLSDLK